MAKEGLKYGDDDESEAELASLSTKYEPLALFLQTKLGDAIRKGMFTAVNIVCRAHCSYTRLQWSCPLDSPHLRVQLWPIRMHGRATWSVLLLHKIVARVVTRKTS